MAAPNDEEKEDLLLACRYGDLQDVQQFVAQFRAEGLASIQDDNANTVLHMACGNGHLDILQYLLPIVPSSLISAQNTSKSTPLHWAALNAHLEIVQALVKFEGGPGIDLIDIKNTAGRTPLGEAELAGWDEGAAWLVRMMNLDAGDGENKEGEDSEAGGAEDIAAQDIEVEIQDADGKIARMTIGGNQSS
ncbi:hypothetical protein PLEOSDRAFT_1077239 [Pleurotus ostreatus PC15]|uniref:Uncharacterized protein n=1 Tax=Pleurotus ostreatus (strain PC15) TaxID=1137138 RepID=A0A067NKE3_PLEO1|nr:hypothetical protein PLEOSDRAFT_1077239 [Pleurotus ostreatus PC15]